MRESKLLPFLAGLVAGVMLLIGVTAVSLGVNVDQMSRMAKILVLIKSESLDEVSNREMMEGAMKGMVGSLGDPYSVYLDPKEYEQLATQMEGNYGGIGIWVGMREDNRLTVISPIKGTPAFREGIKAGDVIVRIDQEEALDMDMDVAVSKMKGEPGTAVVVGVVREGVNQTLDFTLTRELINIPSVEGEIMEEDPEIAYVDIASFSHTTATDLAKLLAEFDKQGYGGMILDLRNNPGGSLQTAVDVADFFVPEGPIVHIVDSRKTHTFQSTGKSIDKPLVVLVNEGSASASEILAGAIKDSGVGTLVGTNTFGKGIVQSIYELSDGTALKLTTSKYLTPSKQDIHQVGIEPDVVVELDLGAEVDNQLRRAMEILRDKF